MVFTVEGAIALVKMPYLMTNTSVKGLIIIFQHQAEFSL